MTTSIDQLAREALEQAERATPGPWGWHKLGTRWVLWRDAADHPFVLDVAPRALGGDLRVNVNGIMRDLMPEHPDAAFIASARAREPRPAAFALEAVEALRRVAEFYAGARALLARYGVNTPTGAESRENRS